MIAIDAGPLVWCPPLLILCGALPALFVAPRRAAWRAAEIACGSAVVLAALAAWAAATAGGPFDATAHALGALITVLGWVVTRYAGRYLDGERGQRPFLVALACTLAASLVVVAADHLALLVAAWVATSLGLHRLLTFYGDRSAARIAAHKKFLASRLAELCLLGALLLTWGETGTLSIRALEAHLASAPAIGIGLQCAAMLFALAALIQCAQLPLHGWLIQVMEAPTPVSALLHAGVVNLGGVVLIRLAPLLAESLPAQVLLVLVGGLTAVLAGLVMMTRVSIKVRLAWSTVAQMGFMLLQCGLGWYALALLHLLAHSVYKAQAFLAAGDTVRLARRQALAPAPPPVDGSVRAAWRLASVPISLALVAAVAWAGGALIGIAVPHLVVMWVAALGLAPLLWPLEERGLRALPRGAARVVGVAALGLGGHALAQAVVAAPVHAHAAILAVPAAALLLTLYVVQAWVLAYPRGALSRRLHPHVYAGFHLDESFTRIALRWWPAPIPTPARPHPLTEPTGDPA